MDKEDKLKEFEKAKDRIYDVLSGKYPNSDDRVNFEDILEITYE